MADDKNEISLTESATMSDSGIHSTPVSTGSSRSNDEVMDFLRELMGEMKQQNVNLRDEMKQQNTSLAKQFHKRFSDIIDSHCHNIIEKMKRPD